MKKNWTLAAIPLALIAILLLFAPGHWAQSRSISFLIVIVLTAFEFLIIGYLVNGRAAGAFIDNRNRLSLSKLQAGAWTVLVLSALATAGAYNAFAPGVNYGSVEALAVTIPGDLLLAMGISATSLLGAPTLLSLKADEQPAEDSVAAANVKSAAPLDVNGKLANKANVADASWSDLFTGEEVGNVGTPDLGKIQQALITLLLLALYAAYVFQSFSTGPTPFKALPTLDKSFIWLMGISHATYLANKAVPHTKSAS